MTEAIFNQGNEDPLQDAKAFMAQLMTHFGTIQQALEENVCTGGLSPCALEWMLSASARTTKACFPNVGK